MKRKACRCWGGRSRRESRPVCSSRISIVLLVAALTALSILWQTDVMSMGPRRLGARFVHLAAWTSVNVSSGCAVVNLTAADVTIDISQDSCNGLRCPPCFIIKKASNTHHLKISGCSSMKFSRDHRMGESGGPYAASMQSLTFVNEDTAPAVLKDGQDIQRKLLRESSASAVCSSSSGNKLLFDKPDVSPLTLDGGSDSVASGNAITINKQQGVITSSVTNLGAGSSNSIVLMNSLISGTDSVVVAIAGACTNGEVGVIDVTPSSGQVTIRTKNHGGSSCASAYKVYFAVFP